MLVETAAPIAGFLLAAAFGFMGDRILSEIRAARLAGGIRLARRMERQVALGAAAVLVAALLSAII